MTQLNAHSLHEARSLEKREAARGWYSTVGEASIEDFYSSVTTSCHNADATKLLETTYRRRPVIHFFEVSTSAPSKGNVLVLRAGLGLFLQGTSKHLSLTARTLRVQIY